MGQKFAAYTVDPGLVTGYYDSVDSPPPPAVKTIPLTTAQWQAAISFPQTAVVSGALSLPADGQVWENGAWATPQPTLAQQAAAAIAKGLAITSAGTPAINGTYACDNAAQAKFSRVYSLIQRAGGNAFPAGLAELPWLLADGKTVVTFTSVATFLNVEEAVGDYVLALTLVADAGTGSLPSATVKIA